MNLVILSGYLGQDPELKYLNSGQAVLTFSLATTERYKSGEQWKENTTWTRCVVWGPRAVSLADHLQKGSFAAVRGSLSTRSWEDREGQKRTMTEVKVNEVDLGPRARQESRHASRSDRELSQSYESAQERDGYDDEIPF